MKITLCAQKPYIDWARCSFFYKTVYLSRKTCAVFSGSLVFIVKTQKKRHSAAESCSPLKQPPARRVMDKECYHRHEKPISWKPSEGPREWEPEKENGIFECTLNFSVREDVNVILIVVVVIKYNKSICSQEHGDAPCLSPETPISLTFGLWPRPFWKIMAGLKSIHS